MKKINIALINCDWTNMYQNSKNEFYGKLIRDQMEPSINNFYFFSWSNKSYYNKSNNLETNHIKTKKLPHFVLDIFYSFFTFPFFLFKNKFDADIFVVYDFGFIPSLKIAKFLFKIIKNKNVEIVLCLNNLPKNYSEIRRFGKFKRIYSFLSELLWKNMIDRFFVINQTIFNYLINLNINPKKINIFSMNTILNEVKLIEKSENNIIRKKFNIPESAKIILSVGRLEVEKNHELMINYFSRLPENFYLIILGRGSLLGNLKELVFNLNISDRVLFPGFIMRDEIWNFYRDADVFALLSRREALGVVFWEAMYLNVPVIGSEEEGIRESLGFNNERGVVVPHESGFGGFKKAIDFCLGNSDARQIMLKNAKDFVNLKVSNKLSINNIFN